MLHSGVGDEREWDGVRPLLEREHGVVTPTLWQEKTLVDIVLDAIPGERAALVGTSLGGRAVLEAATAAPARVSHVVLINTNPFGWSDEVKARGARETALYEAGDLDAAARLMVDTWLVGPQRQPDDVPLALRELVFEMQRRAYDLPEARGGTFDLDAISAPVLYVRGELDWPDVEAASRRFPLVQAISGTAHLPVLERPGEVAEIVLEFLGEGRSTRGGRP